MSNPARKGAFAAARLYLEAPKARELKQCIAIAAKKNDLPFTSIAAYLMGVGARALLQTRDIEQFEVDEAA